MDAAATLARWKLDDDARTRATALVHEAWLKLVDQTRVDWNGRTHFFAVCAQSMRRPLIDHARGRDRMKRGHGWQRVTLGDSLRDADAGGLDRDRLLALNDALEALARLDERQARIVELRFFCGLRMAEIACCGGSRPTAGRSRCGPATVASCSIVPATTTW